MIYLFLHLPKIWPMKIFFVLLSLVLGFLLMSNNAMACKRKSEKTASHKKISSKTDKDQCCENEDESKKNKKGHCGGKCRHSKCMCSSLATSVLCNSWLQLKSDTFNFSVEKQKFYNFETLISSGFTSLWLKPKIS